MTTLAFPTLSRPDPRQQQWGLVSASRSFVSPLTGSTQTLVTPGAERWRVSWTLPPLQEADAALFQAFLVSLSGQAGRFYLYNAARPAPP